MKCQNCGEIGEPGARFCSACGVAFQAVGDERRVVTVLFADLVGFTSLSESLDPERVKSLVDRAFARLVEDVNDFGGRVDKIIGDAIVALFGAPVAHEDDAERAVRAGMRMLESLSEFSDEVGIGIRMRVGINTGEVLVGALRAGGDYTAMGDVVNTASRLQTAASPGEVLVGPLTWQATESSILYEPRGSVTARGKENALDVYAAVKATEAPGFRRRRLTPMVGRDSESALVGEALRLAVRNRRPTAILIMGEAGVGKTRLANEVTPLVEDIDSQALQLTGRCVPYGESNPWWPIADVLRQLIGVAEDDPLDAVRSRTADQVALTVSDPEDAATVVNGLLHVLGYDSLTRDLEPDKARAEAITALLTIVEGRDPDLPVVVRLADLHWASDSVFEFIDAMLGRVSRRSFIVVATARPALLDRWAPPAARGNSVVLQLDPLGAHAAEELLDSLITGPITDDTRAALIERGGGNPFFLEELATLFDAGDQPDGAPAFELPDTLRGLIAARLDGLSVEERHVVEDAAVWGSSGPTLALDELAHATRSVPDVSDEIRALVDHDIFTLDGDIWAFRSDLVREVAYTRITKSDRLFRHLGIARYMSSLRPGRFVDDRVVDIVARHFNESARLAADVAEGTDEDLDREALDWLREAARRAEAAGAWAHALQMYDDAVEVVARGGAGPETRRELMTLRLRRSSVRVEQWELGAARSDAEWVRGAAATDADDEIEVAALCRLGEIATRDDDLELAREYLSEARSRAEESGDHRTLGESLRLMAMGDLFAGRLADAESAVLESLEVFRGIGDRRGEAWALQNLAWIAFALGQADRAEARLSESAAAFSEMGDTAGRSWALGLLAFVRFQQGRFDEARDLGEQVVVEAERRGDRWVHGMVLIVLANVDLWEGRTRLAASLAQRAVELLRPLDERVGMEQAMATAGRAMAMGGDVDAGMAYIIEAGGLRRPDGSPFQPDTTLRWNLMVQLGRSDDIDDAELARWEDDVLAGRASDDTAAVLALVHIQRGEPGRGARVLSAVPAGEDRPNVAAARALVAAAHGDLDGVASAAARIEGARPTYLDRLYSAVARATGGDHDSEALAEARSLAESTEDVFARLLVDTLETALGPETGGREWARMTTRWMEAGGDAAGWSRVIDGALSAAPRV